ncbi:MAG: YidB family protein [Steroidobacteraceae bacterium]
MLTKDSTEYVDVAAAAALRLDEKHGGVQGIVTQMQQQGLGATVHSWVGTGANLPITADQVHTAFGADTMQAMAEKFGLHPQDLAQKLAQALPQAINNLTPGGVVSSR